MIEINVGLGAENIKEVSQNNIIVTMLERGEKGEKGKDGRDGKDFKYEDFTKEQLAALKGEKGDRGERGLQGEKGERGEKGEKGKQGIPGKDGRNADVDLSHYAKTADVEEMLKNFDGGNVRFVDKLPEKGEEGVLYLIKNYVKSTKGTTATGLGECIKIYIWNESSFINISSNDDADELDSMIARLLISKNVQKARNTISNIAKEAVNEALSFEEKTNASNVFLIKE